jgi:hypothetical protein
MREMRSVEWFTRIHERSVVPVQGGGVVLKRAPWKEG